MSKQEPSEELFQKNLELLAHVDPFEAQRIALAQPSKLFFCYTNNGELNLQVKSDGKVDYYYPQEGAEEESKVFYHAVDLNQLKVVYLFGIGLGYDYLALKLWLHEHPDRHLVFFEDDIEVMHYWMHTPLATEILQDLQVTVCSYRDTYQDAYKFYKLHCRFFISKPTIFSLRYYARVRSDDAYLFAFTILYDTSSVQTMAVEVLNGGSPFFRNFYPNLFYLTESYGGIGLFGKYQNIPAIICGAGPSLHKNIEVLKTLKDRALIFAGGSSLNIINSYGLTPHFGSGVDPNPEQYHRLLSNDSYDYPFLYCIRMNSNALRSIKGELLYVSGTGEYDVLKWLESKMDIGYGGLSMGHNVVNFSTCLAAMMGCNPIIFVGLDLAFSESKTYESGIMTHPLWLHRNSPYIPEPKDDVVTRKDIYGNPIKTTWKWINESTWLIPFSKMFPHVTLINATEGGIGSGGVPNVPLAEVAEKCLSFHFDLTNWTHTDIQNNRILKATRSNVWNLLFEWKASLQRCLDYCKTMMWEFRKHAVDESKVMDNIKAALYSPHAIQAELLLQDEISYQYHLDFLLRFYVPMQADQTVRIHRESQSDTIQRQVEKYKKVLENRYAFLVESLQENIHILDHSIKEFVAAPLPFTATNVAACNPEEIIEKDQGQYRLEGGRMIIDDPELDIHLDTPFDASQKITQDRQNGGAFYFYPDGQLKLECYYSNGLLHGPSKCYSQENKLLAQSWFVNGNRQGKSWRFYLSGQLYGIQRYRDGQQHGIQEVFYEDGSPKFVVSYKNGLLDGEVKTYFADKKLHTEHHYRDGKRHGRERIWNNNGKMQIEAEYKDGVPVGIAHEWDLKGNLVKETIIHEYPEHFDMLIWGEDGMVIRRYIDGHEDTASFFESKERETQFLSDAVGMYMKAAGDLLDRSKSADLERLQKEMEDIKNKVKQFDEMQKKIKQFLKEKRDNPDK